MEGSSPESGTVKTELPWWRRVSGRVIGIVLGSMVLALTFTGITLMISWQLEGNAAAVNDAGSLRMRSYRIGLLLEEGQVGIASPVETQRQVLDEMGNVEGLLVVLERGDPSRPLFLPGTEAVRSQLTQVRRHWHFVLESKALAALSHDALGLKSLQEYRKQLDMFVSEINQLVSLIESNDARNTFYLRSLQILLIVMAVFGAITFIYLLLLLVVRPLNRLKDGIERMAKHDLSVHIPVETGDEFGEISAGFNDMAGQLRGLYSTLEHRVAAKTAALEVQNQRIRFLYEMTAWMQEVHDIDGLCQGFLERLQTFMEAQGGTVRLVEPDQQNLHMVVHSGISSRLVEMEQVMPVDHGMCGRAFQSGQSDSVGGCAHKAAPAECGQCAAEGFRMVTAYPIRVGAQTLGLFNLHFRESRGMSSAEKHLLETLGSQLGLALENLRLQAREKEHAVTEERNLVAQGLHDSIAQGLNFLKLQTQMLEDSLSRSKYDEAVEVVPLLRMGIQESYEDVRELLNNFRTRMNQQNIFEAANQIVSKFRRQTAIHVDFSGKGKGAPLSPEEQLQVLFILQEALSNIRKHSQATSVRIEIDNQQDFTLSIVDNGQGFDEQEVLKRSERHVGLAIMRERADKIHAELAITSSPGTGVKLRVSLKKQLRRTA